MLRVLTKDELLNLMAGLPPSVMAMDAEETITTLAATVIEQQAEIERLREAAKRLLDNYGFCSDGSDSYREVPVEDIEALSAALGAEQ